MATRNGLALVMCLLAFSFAEIVKAQPYQVGDWNTFPGNGFEFSPSSEYPQVPRHPSLSAGTWSTFMGLEGSKQPQDFGVNANLGGRLSVNYSSPLAVNRGIGFQIGTAVSASSNAVQVFELLGESKQRFQSFTTAGIFQRTQTGFGWGAAFDYLYQDSFDSFDLTQYRLQVNQRVGQRAELGATFNLGGASDSGFFNTSAIRLEPIETLKIHIQYQWDSQVTTRFWFGVADGHSENNAVTGSLPSKDDQFLFGAMIYAPLNQSLALTGEANLIMPADTGTVDAFLGFEWVPGGLAKNSQLNPFRSMFSVAGSPSFSTDLIIP